MANAPGLRRALGVGSAGAIPALLWLSWSCSVQAGGSFVSADVGCGFFSFSLIVFLIIWKMVSSQDYAIC